MNLGFVAKFQFYVAASLGLFSVACSSPADHKWLVYHKEQGESGYKIKGHVATTKPDKPEDQPTIEDLRFGKPVFDENDRVFIIMPADEAKRIKKCIVEEKEVGQRVDSPVVPPARMPKAAAQFEEYREVQGPVRGVAAFSPRQIPMIPDWEIAAIATEQIKVFTTKQIQALSPTQMKALTPAQIQVLTPAQIQVLSPTQIEALPAHTVVPQSSSCELDLTNKGGFQFTYKLVKEDQNKEKTVLEDTIIAHELYRFRVIAAPVWTTLQKRDKKYSLKTNSAGQSEVAATARQDHPANYTLMLQAYWWKPRDVLDPPRWGDWKDSKYYVDVLLQQDFWDIVFQKINPVIGINLINPNPLNHFYTGLSLEAYPGFDIVAGAHWAKTEQLTAGFAQGQVTTIPPATKERFNNGWFVGVGVDIGVMATWLKYIGQAIPSLQ